MKSKILGTWGENKAKEILLKKNYQILGQNIHFGHLELDIIASKNKQIYFFEVKTRKLNIDCEPDNFINQGQIKNLKRAAFFYAALHKLSFNKINFGLITVIISKNNAFVKIYLNIF